MYTLLPLKVGECHARAAEIHHLLGRGLGAVHVQLREH